jgi:Uma2 family endonuclease
LITILNSLKSTHAISAEAEVRCRLAPDLYRLPDIAVFSLHEPFDLLPSKPPLVVIEVISKDDRASDLVIKLGEYERWGVPRIWVVDPWAKRLAVWKNGALLPVDALTLPEYDFEVRLDQLIEGLPL